MSGPRSFVGFFKIWLILVFPLSFAQTAEPANPPELPVEISDFKNWIKIKSGDNIWHFRADALKAIQEFEDRFIFRFDCPGEANGFVISISSTAISKSDLVRLIHHIDGGRQRQ